VRTLATDEQITVPAKSQESELAADEGREIQDPSTVDDRDGAADGLDVPSEQASEGQEAPAEEQEGWGLQAWYDEEDAAMDQLEIELMLRAAKGRLRIDPDDPAALSILSYYQYLAQDYDSAKKTYDRFIELFPDDAAGYNNKALVYKRLGEYQKEESLYRVALSLSPNDVTAMNNLGVNLAHQKRFEEALAVMSELERIDPFDPYADLHRSKIHSEMGNDEEALRYLEKALEGMERLDTLHHIEFRQDIRLDPSFAHLRDTYRFRAILNHYYGKDSPLEE
jgi:tetratricopeptide (TPR) repeat protein